VFLTSLLRGRRDGLICLLYGVWLGSDCAFIVFSILAFDTHSA
jgi:hypothetical protein